MIGFRVDKAKSLFFDRPKVQRSVDAAGRGVLSRFGAFVRRTARSSIRRRKRVSAPGSPPTSRTGLLRRLLFFVWDPTSRSVVIGPAALDGGDGDGAELLEEGGTAIRRLWVKDTGGDQAEFDAGVNRFRGASGRFGSQERIQYRTGRKAPRRQVRYRPRPYMGPAYRKELPKLPGMWRDSVR